jgi:hypothetical protein
MAEGPPVPISRGVEIIAERNKELRQKAIDIYRRIAAKSHELDATINAALENPSDDSETMLITLFEKQQALAKLTAEAERFILDSFSAEDALTERWQTLQERYQAAL